jgi:hypothetical protein
VLIFGIGKGFLTNLLFTSQKSLKKHTVLSFLGIIKDGKAHSDAGCLSNTPRWHSLSACPGEVLLIDRDLQKSAARGLLCPLVPVHREGGSQLIGVGEIRPPSARGPGGVGSIASSTCTARLVVQADGLSSLSPRHRHPLWPARLCRCHRPGPCRRGGTTLMAYCPAGTTTAVRTLQPTLTSPLPPHAGPSCRRRRLSLWLPRRLLPAPTPGTLTGAADYCLSSEGQGGGLFLCCRGIRRLLLPLSLSRLIVQLL